MIRKLLGNNAAAASNSKKLRFWKKIFYLNTVLIMVWIWNRT
jgi:hypothetical protein